MTGAELREAGEELYGENWRAGLARALDLNPSTIWRYARMPKVPRHIALAVQMLLDSA